MTSDIIRIVSIQILLLLLTACGGGSGSSGSAGGSSSQETGNLSNGTTFVGTDGVTLRALDHTLDSPVDVYIDATPPPLEPMWENTQVVGYYYQLGANRNVIVHDSAFILSLPVPAGADTAHLALAMRVPRSSILDAASTTGVEWTLIHGGYDAASNTFLTTLTYLPEEGQVIVLVTHPDFDSSVSTTTMQPISTRKGVLPPAIGDIVKISDQIFVDCIGLTCTDNDKLMVANHLESVRAELTGMGFAQARLFPNIDIVSTLFDPFIVVRGYRVILMDKTQCPGFDGKYLVYRSQIWICVPGPVPVITQKVLEDATHEYFHAIQFAYPAVYADWILKKDEKFFIEGTAVAATLSYRHEPTPTMYRYPDRFGAFAADMPLGSDEGDIEYNAQDFWVYAGKKIQRDMDSLIPILEHGASIEAINNNLQGGTLQEMYWRFAKNRIIEQTIAIYEPFVFPTCVWRVSSIIDIAYTIPIDTTAFLFSSKINVKTLPPLTSMVVKLVSPELYFASLTPELIDTDPQVKYKIYVNGEPGCEQLPDGPRTLTNVNIPAGSNTEFYIVISNTDLEQEHDVFMHLREL